MEIDVLGGSQTSATQRSVTSTRKYNTLVRRERTNVTCGYDSQAVTHPKLNNSDLRIEVHSTRCSDLSSRVGETAITALACFHKSGNTIDSKDLRSAPFGVLLEGLEVQHPAE
ncbi:hypothetical protein N7499_000557 [Penicillium canescens]|uniref:Uncharacterized protein n=1 Tax=Penicillium canescens TaxID=5083 RepID=A0AAD6NB88_PENCN|nr:uncharacterized protein N7446_011241 [Penicillium canescens]KAJ6004489.1 hypothetical protein N7522_006134 [Penicillium canescens]KAJ6029409.1 hypothetical protein N7444_012396 [Penicillium canescens]KAJ6047840.1 hypothetical protein N7460_003987 [Penicillium canescens]KAJ6048558.1 hypothetical protein N7446_011241 [Penicillium canescens]KAJ6100927.1 hypothetical protein N7499_000557 [Penicillium canescens]